MPAERSWGVRSGLVFGALIAFSGASAARRLHNWGADVQIGLGQDPDAMSKVARHQLDIL